MKYSYTHIYTFLHFNSPSNLSSRKYTSLVGRLENVLKSLDDVEAILATFAIDKKRPESVESLELNFGRYWNIWTCIYNIYVCIVKGQIN